MNHYLMYESFVMHQMYESFAMNLMYEPFAMKHILAT